MAWYAVGTVSVTNGSNNILGSGTAWAADIVYVGDTFYGPDSKAYEIVAVNSATQITLAKPYSGNTASDQSYEIAPTRHTGRVLNASVQDLIQEIKNKVDPLEDAEQAREDALNAAIAQNNTNFANNLVSYQAQIDAANATISLAAIDQTISATATALFVYDTSRDSDGGAWRNRCQHTSWYNEPLNTATRGARREFPAVAVIVVESNKVTIYDGDDPSLPMWMVFNTIGIFGGSGYVTCYALNGQLRCGTTGGWGAPHCDFIKDEGYHQENASVRTKNSGGISKRDVFASGGSNYTDLIVNTIVNDIAMTVLPDAPIDPASKLPVPTIAVATAGGVSVIKDDGTVVDITNSSSVNGLSRFVNFWGGDLVLEMGFPNGTVSYTYVFDGIPSADNVITINTKTGTTQNARAFYTTTPNPKYFDLWIKGVSSGDRRPSALAKNVIAATGAYGLSILNENPVDASKGMVAYTTSDYNTGWMPGDIKGAWLADTDDSDLVGSGELVTNGTFDTDTAWTKGTGWTISGGVASFDTSVSGAGVEAALTQNITTVVGKTYIVKATFSSLTNLAGSELLVRCAGTNLSAWETGSPNILTDGTYTFSFVATSTTTKVNIRATVLVEGDETGSVDNISVKLADADRSVNNKGLIVNGTITRTFVDEV